MSSVDERIVQMRFDNAQFESGVRQTLSSLDKLKQGLKFDAAINGANVLQNAFNGIKLGGINRSVDQLNRKFSSLGIAGMEIVKRVTNTALDSVTRVATAIPNQIKAGGWARALNLENAQFQLKGLGVTWDKINNDIQYAVNGTAYGLDSAAKVAGQLAASNIEVSDSALTATKSVDDFSAACIGQTSAALKGNGQLDEMATALRSISGVAAMSNSSFEEIGQIYTRVAGQGRVFADDLNSIASRGLNASATLGKYLGKTEAEVRDMVSKGQIDFKTFSDAMYDAYADQAVKANNTFQGALSNTKSALSRIGADVADDLLPALTKILNSCRLLFNQVHKWIQPVLDSTGKLVSQIGDTLSPIIDAITAKIAKITGIAGGPIEQIAGFIDKITAKVKGVGNDILSYFGLDPETAKKAEDVAKSVDSTVTASVEHITEMAKRVIHGDFGNEPVRSENLEAIGENFEVIQNKVNELLGCSYRYKVQTDETTSSVNEQTDAIKQTTLSIEDQQKIMRRNTVMNFFKGFENIGKTISLVFTSLGSSIQSFFSTLTPPDWSKFSSDFAKATGVIVNNADRIKEVKQVIDDIVFSIGNTIEAIFQVIGTLGKAIGDVVSKINFKPPTEFTSVIRKISDNLTLSQDSANGLHDIFVTLLSPLKLIVPLIQNISLFVLKMVEGATALNKQFLEFVGKSKILKSVQKIFESIGDAIKKIFDGVKNSSGFQKFIDSIERFASIIGEKLGDAFEKFASWLEKISDVEFDGSKFDGIINAFSTFFDGLSTVIDTISDLIEGKTTIKDVLTKLGESIKEGLTILWDDIREGIRNIDFSQIGDDLKEGLSKIDLSSFNPKEMFSGIKDAIAGAFAGFSFKDAFSGIGKKISDGASEALKEEGTGDNGLDNGLENGLENGLSLGKGETVGEAIINALPKINLPSFSDIINGIGKVFDKIKDWLAPKIKDAIAAIKDAFKDFDFGKFINIIWKIFTNIEFGKIIKGVADFFSGIGDIIKNSGKVVKSVSTLISSIAGIPKQISGLIKDFRKSLKANVFKSFALGVLAIAGALMMISMIKVEKLGPSVLALGVIMAGLVAVVKYVNDMDIDTKKMSSFGEYAILMGVALLAISRAIKRIAGFDAKSLAGAVISLSAVIAVMTACLRKMGDSKINFGTAVGYAIAMSAVVSAVSRGLARLAKYDWKSLIAPAVAMSAVIFAVTKAISQLSKDGPSFGQSVGYAILLGVIVTSVSNALGNLAQYSWQSLTASAIALSGTVAAVIASTNLLNDNGGSFSQSVGYAILLGVIVGSVSSALENLAQYSWQSLTAAAIALSGTIAAIVLSTNLLNDNGVSFGQSVGYAILLGVIVTSVSNALSTLAQYSWESLTTAALALSGTIIAVMAAVKLLSSSNANTIGQALAFAVEVAAVGLSLAVLATLPIPNIVAAAAAIAGVVLALAGAGVIANAGVLGLLALSAAVIAVGAAIGVAAVGIGAGMALASVAAQLFAQAFSVVVETLVSAISELTPLSDEFPSLANGILKLAGAGAVAGLAMVPLSAGIAAVGIALVPFAVGLAVVSAAINVAVAAFGNLANAIGSVIKYIPGLGDVGKGLQSAADDIKNFSAKADKPTENPIQGIIDSVKEGNKELEDELNNTKDVTSKGTSNAASTSQNGSGSAAASNASKTADAVKQARATVKSESAGMVSDTQGIGTAISDNLAPTEASGKIDELISKFTAKTQQGGEASGTAFKTGMLDQLANGDMSNIDISSMLGGNLSPESFGLAGAGDGQAFNQDLINSMMNGDMSNVDISSMFGGNLNAEAFAAAGDSSGQAFSQELSNSIMSGNMAQIDPTSLMSKFGLSQDAAQSNGKNLATSTFGAWADAMDSADPSGPVSEMSKKGVTSLDPAVKEYGDQGTKSAKAYADNIGKVDTTSQGRKLGQGAIKGVNSQKPLFGMAGTSSEELYTNNLSKGDATAGGRQLAGSALRGVRAKGGEFATVGSGNGSSYASAIAGSDQSAAARDAGNSLSKSAQSGLENGSSYAASSGRHLSENYAAGIRAGSGSAIAAARELANEISAILKHSTPKEGPLKDDDVWGLHLGQNIANGIGKSEPVVKRSAYRIASTINGLLGHSTPKEGPLKDDDKWGEHLGQNFATGIDNVSDEVKNSARSMADGVWSEVQKSNANGKKSVDDLAKDLVDKANDTLKKERKIRKVSSSEVTEYWKQLLSKVKDNGKSLLDENSNINDAIYKSAKDLVDNHKEQVNSYLTDESRFWKEVIKLTEEGTEGRENAIKEYNAAILSDPENYIKKQTLEVGEENVRQAEVWKAQMEAVAKDGDNVWDTTKQKLSEDFNKAITTDAGNQVQSYKDRIGDAADATRKFYKDAILYAKRNGATIATQEELMKSYGEAAEADADAQANNYVKKMGWMATNTRQFYINMREEAIKFGASQSAVSKLTEKAGNAMINDLKTTVSMMQEQGKSAREIDKTLSLMMTSIDPAIMTEEMWDSANSVWHENHEKAQEQILSDAENDLEKLGTYYDLSNTQQAVYWKGILKTMDKNSDAYSKAEDKFLAARNAAWKEYTDSVKSSLDKLNSDLSMGSEFKFNEQGFDILGNRQNELAAAEEYGRQVSEAIGRGILSDDVVSQLKESFGVKDTWAWQMINGYSDAQLEQLNNVTQEIIDRNKETAETLNQSIKPDFLYTDDEVKSISDSVQNVMQTMTDITKDPKWSESVAESMITIAGYAAKTTEQEKTQDYVTLGNNLINGAIRGITMRSPALAAACAAAVANAIAAAQAEAQVHSPSKKTTKIGSFMGEGLVLGMKDWLSSAGTMGKNLGDSALSGMNYMLAALASDINDDMDMSPTIRPVIDMSDVTASASAIDSMLSSEQAMRVAAGYDSLMASRQNGSVSSVTNDNSVGSINVNIYPTENQNANDISDAVIKKLNNEIIRKRKVYA